MTNPSPHVSLVMAVRQPRTGRGIGNVGATKAESSVPPDISPLDKSIALIDRDGDFVCRLDRERAEQLVARGVAAAEGKGKRTRLRLVQYNVSAFRSVFDPRRERYTYEERCAGHALVVLKRYDNHAGQFERWDGSLTFEELRAGRMRHREARADAVMRVTDTGRAAA